MGKGEIAHYEQFLLFPQCFQKLSVDASKGLSIDWSKGLRIENSLGKGEICSSRAILLFTKVFSKDLNGKYVNTRACLGEG